MTDTQIITFEGDHIRVESNGDKSIARARTMWTEIVATCDENDCFRVLGISESSTAMPVMDGFDHVELFQELGITTKYRIAWVELNASSVKNLKFIDSALFNRMLPGRAFRTEAEAKAWLLDEKGY